MFECIATGTPTPTISWVKDNLPVNLSDPKFSVPSRNRGALKIIDVQPEDTGYFECVATSIMGMVYSKPAKLEHEGLFVCLFVSLVGWLVVFNVVFSVL